MQTDERVEEETVPNYDSSRYYPVQIRDIFQDRYEVLGKLGYGATSTTWFCRDQYAENFKVLKICIHENGRPLREQGVYSQFSGLRTSNVGYFFTRIPKKRFEVQGPSGYQHACFVFTPAACTIWEILQCHWRRSINLDFVKSTLLCAVKALDFLHSDAHLIHTDVKLDNMFMSLTDDAQLEALAWHLAESPPEFKVDETGRKIYEQCNLPSLGATSWDHAILGDLGEAYVFDEDKDDGLLGPSIVGPAALRPPEVILGMKWGTPLDIWQIGCLFFMLLNKRIPFKNLEGEERWSGCYHLTQMTALMGPPPADYLARSEEQYLECDETCAWGNPGSKGVPDISFDALLDRLEGDDKVNALDFVGRIFRWKPEERSTAKELLEHPFFDFERTGAEETCADETDAEETTAEEASAEEMSSEKKGPPSQNTDSDTSKDCTDISQSQEPSEEAVASPDTLEVQGVTDAGEESQQASIHSRQAPGSKAPIKEEQSSGMEPTEAPKEDESEDSKEEPEQIAAEAKKDCDGEGVREPQIEPLEKLADLQISSADMLQQQ
ncbi:hypothetical protein KC331_g5434 [Hortaea werneckii]|uniref:Protein kinase domain-containing protein n=1 Tax=Hortaea werneckii TaxID=91943 RepID=A0A3M7C246_HORWE|nr:hypothetical protein KC331_g5434 [Hortaea werneckii]RMY45860.1 hypothetical protein D0865_09650 [Hortaea werneckii]